MEITSKRIVNIYDYIDLRVLCCYGTGVVEKIVDKSYLKIRLDKDIPDHPLVSKHVTAERIAVRKRYFTTGYCHELPSRVLIISKEQ